uniref:Cysteine-rich venom protein 1-like n=1 Tax=Diabrotica virgifera virgifera TaxID=50390 RepID=A0A6P7F942_DIAVI
MKNFFVLIVVSYLSLVVLQADALSCPDNASPQCKPCCPDPTCSDNRPTCLSNPECSGLRPLLPSCQIVCRCNPGFVTTINGKCVRPNECF